MDEKRPGEAGGGRSVERTNLDLPLPGKDLLEHVIDVLQCGDEEDFSGKPVDPKEVPIDFGTIRAKVQDGIYNNLNKFELDILLILNKLMISTLPDTDYFKEVQAINDLAEKVFNKLKTDPNGLKSEFPSKRSKRSREPGDEDRSSSAKPGLNHKRQVGDPNDQPRLSMEEFCEKYDLLSPVGRNPSRFSTPSESTPLEQTGCLPMLGIPSPTHQESQHQSAPHGQLGDIYPVDWGAPQQQRQRDDAGPLVQLTHQEPRHTSDPRVRPSGSNPVDQGQQGGIYAVDQGAPQRQRQFDDAGPWGWLTHPYHASHPGESDLGWAEWKEHEQALTMLGQTGYMPMPQQHLLSAPTSQEPQHLSAPHGQQGGIYAVKQGALQQQRQFDDAGPRGQLTHQERDLAPDPGVRPYESDPVGWAEGKEHKQAHTMLGKTGYMPMPPQIGIPQHLVGVPPSQEPQHLSAPRGQQGDIYAVEQGALQQQRQRDDAGPLVRLTHQETHHTSDPRVRPSGSNPVVQVVRQEHEQVIANWSLPGDNDDGSSDEGWVTDSDNSDEDDDKEYDGYCAQDWGTDLESDSDKPFEEWHDVFDDDYNDHDNNNVGEIVLGVPLMLKGEKLRLIPVDKIQTYSELANEISMAYAHKKMEPPVSKPTILCPVPGFKATYVSGTRTLQPDQMVFGDFKSQLGRVNLDEI